MTDNNTLADNNIKPYGKLSSNLVSCYQHPTDIDSESIPSCYDRVCLECGNDHSFKDAITSIDTRQRYFQHLLLQIYYSNSSFYRSIHGTAYQKTLVTQIREK